MLFRSSEKLYSALLPFGAVVVGLSLVILLIVFRSIWVPIKATLGYVFSVAAAFGMTTWVFIDGVGNDLLRIGQVGPVISFMPIMLMGVLFGLAMDYELFLVSRMAEDYAHSGNARESIRTGFVGSAPVVVAAALIMMSVFSGFIPDGSFYVQPIAFGLLVGVGVDAFLVRMTLVPAVLQLLGDKAWYLPKWLDRMLPRLDVEGTGMDLHFKHVDWQRQYGEVVARAENVSIGDRRGDLVSGVELAVRPGDVCWDVGAGTGSVSVELALAAHRGRVYAVECEADACALIRRNRTRFGAWNMTPVQGRAPEALAGLPAPDVVFIGGTGGGMAGVVDAALARSPSARICISAIALETLSAAAAALTAHGLAAQVTQIAVSRTRPAGGLHLLMANNPVFLVTGNCE